MKKILANIICCFILKKKNRQHFRKEYITHSGIAPNKKSNYRIKGNNNKIIIIENNSEIELNYHENRIEGFDIIIDGNDNIIKFEFPLLNLSNNIIHINGDNNNFILESSIHTINNVNFSMTIYGINRLIHVKKNFSICSGYILIEENNTKIVIGEDCMFSHDIFIRNSDGHTILQNNEVINKANDLIIGNHLWFGAHTKILKNVKLANNIIVGMASIVTKSFLQENIAIAGNPAKIIKENVSWIRENINSYMAQKNKIN